METPFCRTPGCTNKVETIDDWVSEYCPNCNDDHIERANEQREWNYYHNQNEE